MKKLVIFVVILGFTLSFAPALAGTKDIIYGFVTLNPRPYGPVAVETYDGISFHAKLILGVTAESIYIGAEVACQVDNDGALYITSFPSQKISSLERRAWLAKVASFNPESYEMVVTSPIGDVRLFIPQAIVTGLVGIKVDSIINVEAVKPSWGKHLIATSITVVTR